MPHANGQGRARANDAQWHCCRMLALAAARSMVAVVAAAAAAAALAAVVVQATAAAVEEGGAMAGRGCGGMSAWQWRRCWGHVSCRLQCCRRS